MPALVDQVSHQAEMPLHCRNDLAPITPYIDVTALEHSLSLKLHRRPVMIAPLPQRLFCSAFSCRFSVNCN